MNEGEELVFELPEFKKLLAKFDLSDNVVSIDGKWAIDLSLNDLSENGLLGNTNDWKFFDDEFETHKGISPNMKLK